MTKPNVARFPWSIAGLSLAMAVAGLGLNILARAQGQGEGWVGVHIFFGPTTAIAYALVGALVAARQPRNPIGWIFCVVGMSAALTLLSSGYQVVDELSGVALPGSDIARWLGLWVWMPTTLLPFTFLLLLFPDGRLPSSRWRPVAWAAGLALAVYIITTALHPRPTTEPIPPHNPFGIPGAVAILDLIATSNVVLLPLGVFGSIAALVVRFRRARGVEREQVKWVAYGGVSAILGLTVAVSGLNLMSARTPSQTDDIVATELMIGGVWIALTIIVIAAGIAILRHGLYDIDLIINRTLVYGTLSGGVIGLYVLLVGALGALFQSIGNLVIGLLATGLAALIIHPLRARLQRSVNRLMYGTRDDPYAVLSRLGERLEATIAPDAVLPAIVQTINDALKLPYVAIALTTDDGRWTTEHQPPSTDEAVEGDRRFVVAEAGTRAAIALALPLVFRHETVGHLLLAPRAPNEAFSPADHRLLHDLARQAGIAVHAVQLTRDLQRSRERLVTAREEERRRLRRDLHDGLGPTLASLTMKLETAEVLVAQDLHGGVALLHDIQGQMKATIGNVRRLVYALRPPVLDQFGLIGALREHALQLRGQALVNSDRNGDDRCTVHIMIDAPDQLPSLPAAVEVAAYYIAVEAMTNVARHAQARQCWVRVVVGGGLMLTIEDDGCGLPAEVRAGVGLHSMRERAAELGGAWMIERIPPHGTRVCAMLPLES